MDLFLQQLFNGLSLGSLYALIAVGYTVVYGGLAVVEVALLLKYIRAGLPPAEEVKQIESDAPISAAAVSVLLLVISLAVLFTIRLFASWSARHER